MVKGRIRRAEPSGYVVKLEHWNESEAKTFPIVPGTVLLFDGGREEWEVEHMANVDVWQMKRTERDKSGRWVRMTRPLASQIGALVVIP